MLNNKGLMLFFLSCLVILISLSGCGQKQSNDDYNPAMSAAAKANLAKKKADN